MLLTATQLGQRLRLARERAGYTQESAATVLGLDATAIAKIERGRRGVGALELKQLAALFGVSVSALLADEAATSNVELRVALRVGQASEMQIDDLVDRLERIIADDRWLREHVEEAAPSPVWKPVPQARRPEGRRGFDRGYQAAESFRARSNLGASPIRDMALLADEVGVLVSRLPLGMADVRDGCAAIDPIGGGAYVLINSDKPRVRRRFTIAHELGHLALGHLKGGDVVLDGQLGHVGGIEGAFEARQETDANAFAAGLLMPELGVKGALKRLGTRLRRSDGPLEGVVWLAEAFGVSEEAAAFRLLNLGLGADIAQYARTVSSSGLSSAAGSGPHEVANTTHEATVNAVRVLIGNAITIRNVRTHLGLAPVTQDAERGVSEVGPAMRARVARALEVGIIEVDQAAGMLHVSAHEAYRWIVESGISLGREGNSSRIES